MTLRWLDAWPVFRQATGRDPLGRGAAAESPRSAAIRPHTERAQRVARSVCPYCAVGCGQLVYVADEAVDMVADRVLDARRKGWQDVDQHGNPVRRTLGFASLSGATLDNEENYLIKKLFTALGAVQIENQARI